MPPYRHIGPPPRRARAGGASAGSVFCKIRNIRNLQEIEDLQAEIFLAKALKSGAAKKGFLQNRKIFRFARNGSQ